jgi:hypothetical protein
MEWILLMEGTSSGDAETRMLLGWYNLFRDKDD